MDLSLGQALKSMVVFAGVGVAVLGVATVVGLFGVIALYKLHGWRIALEAARI